MAGVEDPRMVIILILGEDWAGREVTERSVRRGLTLSAGVAWRCQNSFPRQEVVIGKS